MLFSVATLSGHFYHVISGHFDINFSPLRTVEAPRLIDIDPLHGVHRHHAGHELLCLLTAGRSASLGQANRL
jgi:hypothetical protein